MFMRSGSFESVFVRIRMKEVMFLRRISISLRYGEDCGYRYWLHGSRYPYGSRFTRTEWHTRLWTCLWDLYEFIYGPFLSFLQDHLPGEHHGHEKTGAPAAGDLMDGRIAG